MTYHTRHYINDQSHRQYRLELSVDLLGDHTIACYYGGHRDLYYQPSLESAQRFLEDKHQERLKRHYRVVAHEAR